MTIWLKAPSPLQAYAGFRVVPDPARILHPAFYCTVSSEGNYILITYSGSIICSAEKLILQVPILD